MIEQLNGVLNTTTEAWRHAQPYADIVTVFLANPWIRALGLMLVVAVTIFVIAQVYSGDLQNTEIGPVAIRAHTTTRATLSGVIMPKSLNVPFSMDGTAADVSIHYVYHDARNKRRSIKVATRDKMRLVVQPNNLGPVQDTIYGYEVPDVPQESVCYPTVTLDEEPVEIQKTAQRAPDYVRENKILDHWKEDDGAKLISVPKAMFEDIANERKAFIVEHVEDWQRARAGGFFQRGKAKRLAQNRPNVIGSYYLKFQFRSDPGFVLFKHPDRDLKMTAWLTVLTSLFALLMDAWPKAPTQADHALDRTRPQVERTTPPPRIPN